MKHTGLAREFIEWAGISLNVISALIVVLGLLVVFTNYFLRIRGLSLEENFLLLRYQLARVLVIALEILVIADVIETVTTNFTSDSLVSLAILVIARTWLSWTLELGVEGHWPWQASKKGHSK